MNTRALSAGICRWAGRLSGLGLVAVCVALAVGEGMPNPLMQPLRIQLGFLSLGLLLVALLAGWRWEFPSGVLALLAWVVFLAVVATGPRRPHGFILLLGVPGALFVLSAWLRRRSPPA